MEKCGCKFVLCPVVWITPIWILQEWKLVFSLWKKVEDFHKFPTPTVAGTCKIYLKWNDLLFSAYRLLQIVLHKYRRHIFHQKVSAGYQPYIENRGKDKGLCSGLPEFVDTGFRTQGSHGHCQQESIYIVDKGSQALRQQIERIETDDSQETDSKPRNGDFFILPFCSPALIAGWDIMKLVMSRTGTSIITRIILR